MSTTEAEHAALAGLHALEESWFGGTEGPASEAAVAATVALLDLWPADVRRPSLCPTYERGVSIELDKRTEVNRYLVALEAEEDGTFDALAITWVGREEHTFRHGDPAVMLEWVLHHVLMPAEVTP